MEHDTLATELLKEFKASARRWFIAFCIMVGLEIGTISAFLWYITIPVDETSYEQSVESVDDSEIMQSIGDSSYGESNTESNEEEKSNEK